MRAAWVALCLSSAAIVPAAAQEGPYFVTYDQHMEEPGNLELAVVPVFGHPDGGEPFAAAWLEIEYGSAAWWTTEVYLTGQTTRGQGTSFTGWRFENRFRPLFGDYPVNPVLYLEYEDGDGAGKTLQEVVGFDGQQDQSVPVGDARDEREREIELKLILGSDVAGWNLSENLIAAKNLSGEPWEFGYAIGASRPLRLAATPRACRFCLENFRVGVEAYGGLGGQGALTTRGTSHYLAPLVSWDLGHDVRLRVSPAVGLTEASHPWLLRAGVSYEFGAVGPWIGRRRR